MARNIWYFFLVPGVLSLAGGVLQGVRTENFRRSAERSEGIVIENHYENDSDNGGTYHPEVEWVGGDGVRRRFISSTGSLPASFRVGERVPILYSPERPGEASIDTFVQQWFGTLILSVLGLVFGSIGAIPLFLRVRRSGQAEWLKLNGQAIHAEYIGTDKRSNYEVNGRNPYRISAQWRNPVTNEIQIFISPDLWLDPAPYISSKTITVLIDPRNSKRYWMDLSFLPKLDQS